MYEASDGVTVISNKKKLASDPNLKLIKSTQYKNNENSSPDEQKYRKLTSRDDLKSDAILRYKSWLDNGKVGQAPIIPDRIHNQVMFTPIIQASLMSGDGFIDSDYIGLNFSYENHDDCMSEKLQNLSKAKKNYKFNFNTKVKYPKDVRTVYSYACKSEVVEVRNPVITQGELQSSVKFIRDYEQKQVGNLPKVDSSKLTQINSEESNVKLYRNLD